ncbi:unnamed protein product [Cylicocyclus nassatus]|uniref:AAA+ ATPase domain-containing protein n=1 Tax=Cylicocyclus nassatus TaxID=53992 RepID=A0AA36DPA1_CYLNA|nr:unnamed protein product [Cylicocyclus nassatus]
MDIRGFFDKRKSTSQGDAAGSSALTALKKGAPSTPQSQPKKRSEKIDVAEKKGKSPKKKIPVVNLSDDDDSDGESPIPSSLRKGASEQKRPLRRLISDSDDDDVPLPKSSKKTTIKSASPSPVKPTRTKRSRVIAYDSDEEQSPVKKQNKREATPVHESGDEETSSSETDSENEFVEKKKTKKKDVLPAGQKKLAFAAATKKVTPVKKEKKSAEKLEPVSASDFFGDTDVKGKSSPSKKAPAKSAKISPSQKENAEQKPAKVEQVKEKEKSKTDDKRQKQREADVKSKIDQKQKKTEEVKLEKATTQKTAAKSHKESSIPQHHDKPKSDVVAVPKVAKGEVSVPWVDKYKPKNASHLVGQHGDKSPINKLLGWLRDWGRNNLGEGGRIKKPRPPPFMAQSDGAPFKAVLLSGTPGIGKTTCAVMACETLGMKVVEMNASDVRNKKSLEQQITQLTGSHQIEEYFKFRPEGAGSEEEVKHALIMDEVDGMSGNEDRAGVAELIQIIKETKIPIICICNDRQHPKIRSLANYCFDVRFPKPRVEQIRARMLSIACQEKVKISKEELDQMIEMSGHDVRQSIYNLQLYASAGGKAKVQKKDIAVGPFEAARKLLDPRSTLQEKQDMFFVDYGIMPLFVQENYPNMKNDKHTPKQAMAGLRKAADLIAHSDTIERCIRTTGTWKLLNEQAMLGCALPSLATGGYLRAMIQFPAWLGKNSTAGKRQRLMRQLATHAHLKISADMHSLVADYIPVLRDCLTKPLLERETDGVNEVVCTMNDYDLMREDSEAVGELAVWPGKIDPASKILPKVKAALTRALNKEHRMLPYATEDMSKGRKKAAQQDYEIEIDEEGNIIERLEDDDSEFEDDSDDQDYKPGGKSKAKAKPTPSATRGRGRGGGAAGPSRGGPKRGRGK